MSKQEWGRATWYLIHTLAHKLKDEESNHAPELLAHLSKICITLPCPNCSQHASLYLQHNSIPKPTDKSSLNAYFWNMHNWVNTRLGKPIFSSEECFAKYNLANINNVVNYFITIMSKNARNNKAMLDAFNRQQMVKYFTNYLKSNHHRFNY